MFAAMMADRLERMSEKPWARTGRLAVMPCARVETMDVTASRNAGASDTMAWAAEETPETIDDTMSSSPP